MSEAPKILLVRFSSMGDIVLTTPLVRAIKSKFPRSALTYVTKRAYAPLLEENPNIFQVLSLNPGESLRSLAGRIGTRTFDFALDLHSSLRSVALRQLLGGSWGTYGKRRLQKSILIHTGVDFFTEIEPVAERYFEAATAMGITPDGKPPEVRPSRSAVETASKLVTPETILLAPGARHHTKRWSVQRWRKLAITLRAAGKPVFAIGQPGEDCFPKADGIPGAFDIDLDIATAITKISRTVVSNDSGFMHLATAVGTPVIAIVGPTVRQFGFFPYSNDATVVERSLGCRPCSASGSSRCHLGHHNCLEGIQPEEIFSLIEAA
jgi:ADP-heptose:LPS heptosyltransferase